MKTFGKISFLFVALSLATAGWGQAVFNKFGPAAGIQKNTGTTYQNTAAAASDVTGLYSGCTGLSTQYLAANNTCQPVSGAVSGANPTASVGLTATNGSATTYMRSDASPLLSQSIAPTWTGTHTFANTTANIVLNNSGGAADTKNTLFRESTAGFLFQSATDAAPTTAVTSIFTAARSGTAWTAVNFGNATDNPAFSFLGTGQVSIAGGTVVGSPTGGNQGAGTINMQGCFVNGVACSTGGSSGANPTGTVGLTAVNGAASTYMRSDAAPPLSQAIAPTWTGSHIFAATSGANVTVVNNNVGAPFAVTGIASRSALAEFAGNGNTAGTSSLAVGQNSAGGNVILGRNNAALTIGTNGATHITDSTTGAITIAAPSSGVALAVNGAYAGATVPLMGISQGAAGGFFAAYDGTHETLFGNFTSGGFVGTFSNHEFDIRTNNAPRIAISSSGGVSINAPSSGNGLIVNGLVSQNAVEIQSPNTASVSFGLRIDAGTNSADRGLYVGNAAQSTQYFAVLGDGGAVVGSPVGGDKGLGTVNMTACYVNNVPCLTGSSSATRFTAGVITIGASSCTVNQNTSGISGCTFNSTGNVTVTFSSAFTAATCVANAVNANPTLLASQPGTSITSGVQINLDNTSGTPTNGILSVICLGS